jgi:hypothetical protein
MSNTRTVAFGLFHDLDWARGAQDALKAVGFASQEIGLLESRRAPARHMVRTARLGRKQRRSGPVPAHRESSPARHDSSGTEVGPLGVALTDTGMPEDQAQYLETQVRQGNSLVGVRTRGNAELAASVLYRFGAYDVRLFGRQLTPRPLSDPALVMDHANVAAAMGLARVKRE